MCQITCDKCAFEEKRDKNVHLKKNMINVRFEEKRDKCAFEEKHLLSRYYTDFCDRAPILDLVNFHTPKSVN